MPKRCPSGGRRQFCSRWCCVRSQTLGERRKDGLGSAGLWSDDIEVSSVFRCPRATGRCTATRTRDEQGGWPMRYLHPDDPDGVPLKPAASGA